VWTRVSNPEEGENNILWPEWVDVNNSGTKNTRLQEPFLLYTITLHNFVVPTCSVW